jgi:hypothetical protein
MTTIKNAYTAYVCAVLCDRSPYYKNMESKAYLRFAKDDKDTYATITDSGIESALIQYDITKQDFVHKITEACNNGQKIFTESDVMTYLFAFMPMPVCLTADEAIAEVSKFIVENFS